MTSGGRRLGTTADNALLLSPKRAVAGRNPLNRDQRQQRDDWDACRRPSAQIDSEAISEGPSDPLIAAILKEGANSPPLDRVRRPGGGRDLEVLVEKGHGETAPAHVSVGGGVPPGSSYLSLPSSAKT